MSNKPTVIDLFSGCGGLSHGFLDAGYKILLGIDNWQDALETFKHNHPGSKTINADLAQYSPKYVARDYSILPGKVDVIVGGPPCQGFSISGKRMIDDPRNILYRFFVNFVAYYKPKAFVMENVPNLLSIGDGKVKKQILEDFEGIGYTVSYKILLASEFGVPQNRRRVFFVGTRNGKQFLFPAETHGNSDGLQRFVTTRDAIDDLPEGRVSDGSKYGIMANSPYQKKMRMGSLGIYGHDPVEHKDMTVKIISMVPDGGNYKDLPKLLQRTRRVNIAWTRMNSSKPSFTIDTGHNHHFHYKYNRVPTARESARIQSFPDKFIFSGNKASQLKQVGNAVPPMLARQVAKKLLKYL